MEGKKETGKSNKRINKRKLDDHMKQKNLISKNTRKQYRTPIEERKTNLKKVKNKIYPCRDS